MLPQKVAPLRSVRAQLILRHYRLMRDAQREVDSSVALEIAGRWTRAAVAKRRAKLLVDQIVEIESRLLRGPLTSRPLP